MVAFIWASVIVLCVFIIAFFCTISPFEANLRTWCETRKHVSDNKKEVELRRLEVLEKTPELRKLVFHPNEMEKSE